MRTGRKNTRMALAGTQSMVRPYVHRKASRVFLDMFLFLVPSWPHLRSSRPFSTWLTQPGGAGIPSNTLLSWAFISDQHHFLCKSNILQACWFLFVFTVFIFFVGKFPPTSKCTVFFIASISCNTNSVSEDGLPWILNFTTAIIFLSYESLLSLSTISHLKMAWLPTLNAAPLPDFYSWTWSVRCHRLSIDEELVF